MTIRNTQTFFARPVSSCNTISVYGDLYGAEALKSRTGQTLFIKLHKDHATIDVYETSPPHNHICIAYRLTPCYPAETPKSKTGGTYVRRAALA